MDLTLLAIPVFFAAMALEWWVARRQGRRVFAWRDTLATFHLWTQIVGKTRLALSPWLNHGWQVPLYVDAHGLGTSPIDVDGELLEIAFDLVEHRLVLRSSHAPDRGFALEPMSVARFHERFMRELRALGIDVTIGLTPNEVPHPIAFDRDEVHRAYDPEYAQRFWRALVQADRVFKAFRARFRGKSSPVHFFWGAADLAVTRFSGRAAPEHPGGIPSLPDRLVREAYSHECASCGFWAGGEHSPRARYLILDTSITHIPRP